MRQMLMSALLLCVIVIAGVMLFRSGQRPAERMLKVPFEQMGSVLARETLRAVPGNGRIAVVRYRLATSADNSVLGPAAETFLRAIRDDGRLKIAETVDDEYNPFEREAGWTNTMMESARFMDFVAKHHDVDAVVIVGGTPQLSAADAKRIPSPHPKIIAASVLTTPAKWLLADGVIASAIISRAKASEERTPPKSPQDWFDRRYEVVTAANAGELP